MGIVGGPLPPLARPVLALVVLSYLLTWPVMPLAPRYAEPLAEPAQCPSPAAVQDDRTSLASDCGFDRTCTRAICTVDAPHPVQPKGTTMTNTTADRSAPLTQARDLSTYLPFAGRVMIAAIFLLSGLGKIAAPAATIGYIGSVGLPLPTLGYALAILVEVGGGLALLAGFHVRPVAIALAGSVKPNAPAGNRGRAG
jgi:hypothetical protein